MDRDSTPSQLGRWWLIDRHQSLPSQLTRRWLAQGDDCDHLMGRGLRLCTLGLCTLWLDVSSSSLRHRLGGLVEHLVAVDEFLGRVGGDAVHWNWDALLLAGALRLLLGEEFLPHLVVTTTYHTGYSLRFESS